MKAPKINWQVRLKSKKFWLAMIPAILYLVNTVAGLFGYNIELEGISNELMSIVEAVFTVLVIMGVTVDPTTKGVSDSEKAMTYKR